MVRIGNESGSNVVVITLGSGKDLGKVVYL